MNILNSVVEIVKNLVMFFSKQLRKLKPVIKQVVEETEKAMEDGIITADERQKIVETIVIESAEEYGIHLNWLKRIVVRKVIDNIAESLPTKFQKNIEVPDIVRKVATKKPSKRKEYIKQQVRNNFAK